MNIAYVLRLFEALLAIGLSLVLALSCIAFLMFIWDEVKQHEEEDHDDVA